MGPVLSTAKASKGLKNFSKGLSSELFFSQTFHQTGIPILVSPLVLRQRECGQCDMVRFNQQRKVVEVVEVKSSHQEFRFSHGAQLRRLRLSADFLAQILNQSVLVRIEEAFAKKEKLP